MCYMTRFRALFCFMAVKLSVAIPQEVQDAISKRCLQAPEAQNCGCSDVESCNVLWGSAVGANMGQDSSNLHSKYGVPGPYQYKMVIVRGDPRVIFGTIPGSVFGTGGEGNFVADVVSTCKHTDSNGKVYVNFSKPECYTLKSEGQAAMMDQVSEFMLYSKDQPGYPLISMENLPVLLVAYPIDESNPDMHFPVFQMSDGTYADAGGYSVYATLMASHGFVAVVPFIYWPPFGVIQSESETMDDIVTYTGNAYISKSLDWVCTVGYQDPRAYCPLGNSDSCSTTFIAEQLPGMQSDCMDKYGNAGVALGGHSGGGAWALWAGLNYGINPVYKVKGLMLHEAGLIPGFNAPMKFNWERARGSGLKILAMAGRWMTLLKEQHTETYNDPALDGCTGNLSRDGSNCAGASPFGWFPPGVDPAYTTSDGNQVNLGQTTDTTKDPNGIFGQWNEYTNKYGGACSDGIGSAGLGTQYAFVVEPSFPLATTGLPPPSMQNFEVGSLNSSLYLDSDVVLVGANWQHVASIANWMQGANITTVTDNAKNFGNLNANGVGYVPMAAKFGVAWAYYVFMNDSIAQDAIFQEGSQVQKYCNLATCAGFSMPGTNISLFGTFLTRAGGNQASDIKCVEAEVLVEWRHRGQLVANQQEIQAVDKKLGPQLLSPQACSPGVPTFCANQGGTEELFQVSGEPLVGASTTNIAVSLAAGVLLFLGGVAVGRRSSRTSTHDEEGTQQLIS